jgi:hypothetical protein
MARTKGRVVLTANPKENLELAQKIYDKHLALGTNSSLNIIEGVDWAVTGPKVAVTKTAHDAAEFHKGEMEKEYAKRDANMPEISKVLKLSINLLKASYGDTPKKLTDWGIAVDDSPKPKKIKN